MTPEKPGIYNLNVNQGKLYEKTFTWKIDDAAVDLAGYLAKIHVWDSRRNVILSLTTDLDDDGNGLVLGGSQGTVQVVIKTAKTADLTAGSYRYDLQLTRPDGEDIPFLAGGFYVTEETGDS